MSPFGTSRLSLRRNNADTIGGTADVGWREALNGSAANDPQKSSRPLLTQRGSETDPRNMLPYGFMAACCRRITARPNTPRLPQGCCWSRQQAGVVTRAKGDIADIGRRWR